MTGLPNERDVQAMYDAVVLIDPGLVTVSPE
jgi:hypothetical protein